jgi:hypothetical protein
MDCIGANPNLDLFICVNGGWVPANNPTFVAQPAPPSTSDVQPPTTDEFEDIETYPGSGILTRVLTRTADPSQWFRDGARYRHPYGFIIKVEGIALKQFGTRWFWCHRLVIIETVGDPPVGHVMHARLFAPQANWTEVQE